MTCKQSPTRARPDDVTLQGFVESALRRASVVRGTVHSVSRRHSEYQSSCALEELTVKYDDDRHLVVIFKNLSAGARLKDAEAIRPGFLYSPGREIYFYRDLLQNTCLETASVFGARSDDRSGEHWLLLEKVPGDELYKIGDFALWRQVARWLARMHHELMGLQRAASTTGALLKYDAEFYHRWVDRAERHLLESSETRGGLSKNRVRGLLQASRQSIPRLCRLTTTIIHGEFYASNILVARREKEARVCPVDWETVAIGPALFDVAALISGNWSQANRRALIRDYRNAMSSNNDELTDAEFYEALRLCRMHTAIRWLGWSPGWTPPVEHQCNWLAEALKMSESPCVQMVE